MAEPSRNDAAPRSPQYPQGANNPPTEFPVENRLPAGDIYGNQHTSRSAEAVGRRVGAAIFQVRQVPRRLDTARYRLREFGGHTRANASARVLEMMDTAATRAERLRQQARENMSNLADRASYRASEMGDRAAERWQEFRHASEMRLHEARRRVEAQWVEGRRTLEHWQREDPVRFVAVVAGSAFVIGAALRIWRSNHE